MDTRADALREAIIASPDQPELYWVYADYLQTAGDPRGELIALDGVAEREPARRPALLRARRRLLAVHGPELLGSLAGRRAPALFCHWRLGFIKSARIAHPGPRWWELDPLPIAEALLASPSAAFLRQLEVFCHPRFHGELRAVVRAMGPATLGQPLLARRHSDWQQALNSLDEVRWLWLDLPEPKPQFPPRLFTLSALQRLEVSAPGLTALPPQLGWLSSLVELDLYACPRIGSLPEAVVALPSFQRLGATDSAWDPEDLSRLNRLLRELSASEAGARQRAVATLLLQGELERAIEFASDEELLGALDSSIWEVRDGAFRALEQRRGGHAGGRIPLEAGAKVVLRGVAPGVRAWAASVLPRLGVELQRRPGKGTTHVVVGRGGTASEALAASTAAELLVESELAQVLSGGQIPRTEPEDVLGAQLAGSQAELERALGALEAGGELEGLVLDLVSVFCDARLPSSTRMRAHALAARAAPRSAEAARSQLGARLLRCGETRCSARIASFAAESGEDGVLLARLLLGRVGRGLGYILEHGSPEAILWALDQLREEAVLDLSRRELPHLPAELAQLTEVRVLRLGGNPLVELPEFITALGALEELDLDSCTKLRRLPEGIERIAALRVFRWSGHSLRRLPHELTALSQLEVLDLDGRVGGPALRELSAHIGALRRLRVLGLSQARLKAFPPGLFRLAALEELRLIGAELPALPEELSRLGALRKLVVMGSSWDEPACRERLGRLLPHCTVR